MYMHIVKYSFLLDLNISLQINIRTVSMGNYCCLSKCCQSSIKLAIFAVLPSTHCTHQFLHTQNICPHLWLCVIYTCLMRNRNKGFYSCAILLDDLRCRLKFVPLSLDAKVNNNPFKYSLKLCLWKCTGELTASSLTCKTNLEREMDKLHGVSK